jgi:MFS family permease
MESPAAPRNNPLWIPPFLLGRVPQGVDERRLRLLGVVSLALLFEEYDVAILTAALRHIARDLGLGEQDLGLYLAIIRAGALPAFFVVPLADRVGRRPVFLWSTALLGLFTFATAFARTGIELVALQALTRTFFVAGASMSLVFIAEEFPATHRGWAVGMLAALGTVGHGLGALLFAAVDVLPFGWRALYAFGGIPVLLVPWLARSIPETSRFTAHAKDAASESPLLALLRASPLRAASLGAAGFLIAAATLPVFQFTGYYTQKKLGWTPAQYATMVLALGAIGVLGNVAAGRLGDLFGRKRVGVVLLAVYPFAAFGFYRGDAWWALAAWVPLVFCSSGARVILRALSSELFPTRVRGAATGLYGVMETLGAVSGMLLVYFVGTQDIDALAHAVPMASLLVIGTACLLFTFPETGRRELEDIS